MKKQASPFYKEKLILNLTKAVIIISIFMILSCSCLCEAQYSSKFPYSGFSSINPITSYMYNYNDYPVAGYNYRQSYAQSASFPSYNSIYNSIVSFPSPYPYGRSPYGGPYPSQDYYNYIYGMPSFIGSAYGINPFFPSWIPWLDPTFSYFSPGSMTGYFPQVYMPPYYISTQIGGGDRYIPIPKSPSQNIPSPAPGKLSGTWKSEVWPEAAGHPISGKLELNRTGDPDTINMEGHVGEGTMTSFNYTPTSGESSISFSSVFDSGGTASFSGTADNQLCPQNVYCFWSGSFTVEGTYTVKDSTGLLVDEGTFTLKYPENL